MTMCTSREDTMNLPISTNTNFFSDNGIAWHDFASINVANNTLSCEPNFYAYTNNMGYTLEVSNLSNDNNIITINLNKTNINDNDNILYKIYDSNNNDITSQFIIEKDYTNNKVTVYSNNSLYGTYKIEINYKDIKIENDVELTETFTISNNSMIKMNKNTLLIKVNNQSQLTSELLMNNININNLEYIIKDNNNEVVENAEIGTNYSLLVNNITFKIVVIGDTTGDGVVNSADLLKIVKYLKGTVTLNDLQKEAADASRDKTINSADLLKIVKYLKGVTQFTF